MSVGNFREWCPTGNNLSPSHDNPQHLKLFTHSIAGTRERENISALRWHFLSIKLLMRLVYERLGNGDATRGQKHQFDNFSIYSCIHQHDVLVVCHKDVGLGIELVANNTLTLLLHTGYRFPWTIPRLWRYASPCAICMICQLLMSLHYQLLNVAYQLQFPSITDRPLVDELQNVAIFVVWRYQCSVGFHVDDGFWRDVQVLRHFTPPQVVAHLGSVSRRTCTLPRTIDIPCSDSLESLSSRLKQSPSTYSGDCYCGPSSAIDGARNSFDGSGCATRVAAALLQVDSSF